MLISPIPGARAALGDLHVHEGKDFLKAGQKDKAGAAFGAALTEYVNVLKKLPEEPGGAGRSGTHAGPARRAAEDGPKRFRWI